MYVYKHYNTDMEIIYIGCCKNMARRQYTHFSQSFWRNKIFFVEFKKVEASKAKQVEKRYIKKYRPTYNIEGVPGKRIMGYAFYKPIGGKFPKNTWVVHVYNKNGDKYFGTFSNRFVAAEVADLMNFIIRKDYRFHNKAHGLY